MKILSVTSECAPLVKTGGLADVCGALPPALAGLGAEMITLLPGYPAVMERLADARVLGELPELAGHRARLLLSEAGSDRRVFVVDAPHLFMRAGHLYLGPDGKDWPDNALRFAAFSQAAAHLARQGATLNGKTAWRPDILHAHDWQAALSIAYTRYQGDIHTASILTVHNLAFQGVFPPGLIASLNLPANDFHLHGYEFYGQIGFLKAGLVHADKITTVSPTYAREIQTPAHGMGLEGLLAGRASDLVGIVNGIDDRSWDPANDPALAAPYSVSKPTGKAACKRALQERLGLTVDLAAPLFCAVTRLTHQKGIDLLTEVLPGLLARGGQFAMLGSGDAELEHKLIGLAASHSGQVSVTLGYDEPLSHQLQAGSDVIVVPSRFEPCGLTQLYGLRYGTLPLVARVGGLADTVIDANEAALNDGVATGFQFSPVNVGALGMAIERTFELWAQPDRWQAVRAYAMGRDVSWRRSAARYLALYQGLVDRSPQQAA